MSTSLSVKIPSQDIGNAFKYFWNLLGLSTRVTGICECIEEKIIYIKCNVTTHETSENLTNIQKSIDMVGYADVYGVNHMPTDCWRLYPQQSIIYVKVPDKYLEKVEETLDISSNTVDTEPPKTEPPPPESILFTFKPPTFTFAKPSDSFKPFGQTSFKPFCEPSDSFKSFGQISDSFKPFGLKEPNFKVAKIEPIGKIEQIAKESVSWLNQQEFERY